MKGLWRGSGIVTFLNAEEVGTPADGIPVADGHGTWGSSESVESGQEHVSTAIPVLIALPPGAAGKTVQVHAQMHVVYPLAGTTKFEEKATDLTMDTELRAATTPHAGAIYGWTYYSTVLSGCLAFLVLSFTFIVLTSRHKAKALPPKIVMPATDLADDDEAVR